MKPLTKRRYFAVKCDLGYLSSVFGGWVGNPGAATPFLSEIAAWAEVLILELDLLDAEVVIVEQEIVA